MSVMNYGHALADGLVTAMEQDPNVVVFGIGVDDHKAIFGSLEGALAKFGPDRVFDTPLAESAMTGVAIGMALAGMKAVHVHIRMDFMFLAMDQIFNMAAKWRSMYGGQTSVPIVIRGVIGRSWGQGAQHSQSLVSLFAHFPGLKVVMPTTPADAKGYMMSAIHDPNPVIIIEHRLLYYIEGEVPEGDYRIPFGTTFMRRKGKDITVVANSYMVAETLQAAAFLAEHDIDVEILDPVSIVPLNMQPILESIKKTGQLLVLDTSWTVCGVSAEIIAQASEQGHGSLKGAPRRMGCAPAVCPVAKNLENAFYPNAVSIAQTICDMLGKNLPLKDVPILQTKFKGPF